LSLLLKNLLDRHHEITPLLEKARAISILQSQFLSAVPPQFAHACQVIGLHQGTLVVSVTSTTIAAKLRQLAPQLVTPLQNMGSEVNGIRVKVQVSYSLPSNTPVQRELSPAAKNTLRTFSSTLNESPLKKALNKIIGSKS
jgi:hypothetical protein